MQKLQCAIFSNQQFRLDNRFCGNNNYYSYKWSAMKKIILVLISLYVSCTLFAQSADFITELISSEKVTFGQFCYFSAIYQNLVSEDASETDAVNAFFELGYLPAGVDENTFITYEQASRIFVGFWNIKGGLFYRLSGKSGRYAFKQFKADGIIPAKIDPGMIPGGTDILNIYTMGDIRYASAAKKGDAQ